MKVPKFRWARLCALAGLMLAGQAGEVAGQQVGTIRGVVRTVEGGPVSAAQVFLDGQRLGTISGVDGRYTIASVPAGTYTVVSQVIGYGTVRREGVTVAAGASVTVDFEMRVQAMSLSEIVVTGVSEATSRALVPFTVGRIGGDEIPVPPANAVAALQGKVAGVNIVSGSQPGSGLDILLRTPTSINRETAPLLVVDGVILGASSADISTLDIESIEVIKGAAAASLYGSRAAAGVVQIRTRRGSALPQDQTRITVRSEFGTSDIPRPIQWAQHHNFLMNGQGQFLNAQGQVVPRSLATTTQFGFQDQAYPGVVYNNIATLFNPGSYSTNSVTFGHNSGGTSWLGTVSNHQEQGVVRENRGYDRTDFRLNLDHRLRDDLSLSVSTFHMRSERENLYGNVFFDFVQQAPDVDLLQPDPDGTKYIFQPDDSGIRANPLYMIVTQDRTARRLRTMGSLDVRYTPTDWLGFDLSGSYDRSDRRTDVYIPKGVKTAEHPTGNPGFASRETGIDDALNASAGVSLTRQFGPLRTRTLFRGSFERNEFEEFMASGNDMAVGGIPNLEALRIPAIESDDSNIRTSGYLVNSDLNWDERYILSALVRRDGSSVFGPEERWHTYYRASGAYRMGAERWWPLADVSEFKLRYSVGTAGGRPSFADQYEVFTILSGGGLSLSTLGNRFLKPEKSREQEMGLDVVAFDRFSLQLTYATQITRDQLVNVPLPSLFGFTSQWQNAGTVEGHTYEGTLETRLITRPGLSWSVTLLADRSRNTITEYDRPCHLTAGGQGALGYRCAGERIGNIYTQKLLAGADDLMAHRGGIHAGSAGAFQINDDGLLVPVGVGNSWRDGVAQNLWGTNVVIDGVSYAWGMPIPLTNEDGTRALVRTGDSNPTFRWGFSNQVQVGRLAIYGLLDSQVGGDVYNATKQRMYQWQRHGDEDQHNKPEENKKPVAYYTGPLYNGNANIDWFVEDGSYVKLREVALRYRLDGSRIGLLQRVGMDNAALSLIGRNLLTWTNYSGYDPEIGTTLNRRDNFNYPNYRTLTGSVEITF